MPTRRYIRISDAIIALIKQKSFHCRVIEQVLMVLLPGHSQYTQIDRGQSAKVGGGSFGLSVFHVSPMALTYNPVTIDVEHVNRQTRKHSVTDIEALRHCIETECDQGLDLGCCLISMLQSSSQ